MAGRACYIEVEAHAVVPAPAHITVDGLQMVVAAPMDVVVIHKAACCTPDVASKGLLERDLEAEEGHRRGVQAGEVSCEEEGGPRGRARALP